MICNVRLFMYESCVNLAQYAGRSIPSMSAKVQESQCSTNEVVDVQGQTAVGYFSPHGDSEQVCE